MKVPLRIASRAVVGFIGPEDSTTWTVYTTAGSTIGRVEKTSETHGSIYDDNSGGLVGRVEGASILDPHGDVGRATIEGDVLLDRWSNDVLGYVEADDVWTKWAGAGALYWLFVKPEEDQREYSSYNIRSAAEGSGCLLPVTVILLFVYERVRST